MFPNGVFASRRDRSFPAGGHAVFLEFSRVMHVLNEFVLGMLFHLVVSVLKNVQLVFTCGHPFRDEESHERDRSRGNKKPLPAHRLEP